MGYRSDMKALVYPPSGEHNLLEYEKLKTLMNTTFKDFYDYWQDPHLEWDDKHRVLKFSIESVKWYDSYPEVVEFNRFLTEVHDLGYVWESVRLGENDDDVEFLGSNNAEWYLSVRREIEVNL
jgi:hypothetical protein